MDNLNLDELKERIEKKFPDNKYQLNEVEKILRNYFSERHKYLPRFHVASIFNIIVMLAIITSMIMKIFSPLNSGDILSLTWFASVSFAYILYHLYLFIKFNKDTLAYAPIAMEDDNVIVFVKVSAAKAIFSLKTGNIVFLTFINIIVYVILLKWKG